MPGPGPMRGAVSRPKNMKKTLLRILSYMREYRLQLVVVLLAVMISSGANVAGTYFLKPLINNYILPFVGQESQDLSECSL